MWVKSSSFPPMFAIWGVTACHCQVSGLVEECLLLRVPSVRWEYQPLPSPAWPLDSVKRDVFTSQPFEGSSYFMTCNSITMIYNLVNFFHRKSVATWQSKPQTYKGVEITKRNTAGFLGDVHVETLYLFRCCAMMCYVCIYYIYGWHMVFIHEHFVHVAYWDVTYSVCMFFM